jgi:hypothetical protein
MHGLKTARQKNSQCLGYKISEIIASKKFVFFFFGLLTNIFWRIIFVTGFMKKDTQAEYSYGKYGRCC